jgi:hypothetical protein
MNDEVDLRVDGSFIPPHLGSEEEKNSYVVLASKDGKTTTIFIAQGSECIIDNDKVIHIYSKASDGPVAPDIVLLIHGIRTQGEWEEMVTKTLSAIPSLKVMPLKYEFFDALHFLCPIFTRKRPVKELLWKIRDAKERNLGSKVSVIAHSFGCYAIATILRSNPDIRLHRLVLCGSVVPRRFRWDMIGRQIDKDILNECAMRDIWPVLAQSSTWGYGASGTFGFGSPGMIDRYHRFGHSGFFSEEFVREFWLPWFSADKKPPADSPQVRPYLLSLLTVIQLKWLFIVIVLIILCYLCFHSRSTAGLMHAQQTSNATR